MKIDFGLPDTANYEGPALTLSQLWNRLENLEPQLPPDHSIIIQNDRDCQELVTYSLDITDCNGNLCLVRPSEQTAAKWLFKVELLEELRDIESSISQYRSRRKEVKRMLVEICGDC